MREEELFLSWQKGFRRSDDGSQRCRHLKTDEDENDAPYSEISFASSTEKPAGRIDQP